MENMHTDVRGWRYQTLPVLLILVYPVLCSSFDDVLGFFHLQAAQQTLGNPVGDWPSHCDGSSEEDHGKSFLYSVNSLGTVSH